MNYWRFLRLALAAALLSGAASAKERVRLLWDAEGAQCPDQPSLEAAISARLGYSPFDDQAPSRVVALVRRRAPGLQGTLELFDAAGQRQGRRVFDSPTDDCSELAASMELAITIAIDPQASAAPAPRPALPPAPEPAPAPAAPAPPAPGPEHAHFAAAVGAAAELGLGPTPSGDLSLQLSVRYRALLVGLEGWGDLPTTAPVPGGVQGSAHANLLAGSVLVCGAYRWVGLCAVGTVAALLVAGDVGGLPTRATVVVPLAGVRAWGHFELGAFALEPFAELDFVANRVTIRTPSETVWAAPPVGGKLGLSLAYRFF